MTRKIERLDEYISAKDAADILSKKLGRFVDPDYIRRVKNVRSVKVNATAKLYNKQDIKAATIRKRKRANGDDTSPGNSP